MPSQDAPFKAEIEFYNLTEIIGMLRGHYDHYHGYYVNRPAEAEGDELQQLEENANTAFDVFRAIFADHDELKDEELSKAFLSSCAFDTLSQWLSTMMAALALTNNILDLDADSSDILREKLDPFTLAANNLEDEEDRSPSYWPLVRLVRIGLHSPLLRAGLVIADLPGNSIYCLVAYPKADVAQVCPILIVRGEAQPSDIWINAPFKSLSHKSNESSMIKEHMIES